MTHSRKFLIGKNVCYGVFDNNCVFKEANVR